MKTQKIGTIIFYTLCILIVAAFITIVQLTNTWPMAALVLGIMAFIALFFWSAYQAGKNMKP